MRKVVVYLLSVVILSSCSFLRPDIMLKTPKNFVYSPIKDTTTIKESKISQNDNIDFKLFSNDGFKLIDLTGGVNTVMNTQSSSLQYVVESDGTVKLPVLGSVKLAGLNIREAETMLELKYSQYYVKPFVILKVNNKRVIIFPGSGGSARVLPILNNNTTLIEALAGVGGLPEYAKSYKIKIIRGDPQKPTVYLIDLSTISGIALANMVIQANDIIYVEPRIRVSAELLKEIDPYLSFISSMFLVYTVYLTVNRY